MIDIGRIAIPFNHDYCSGCPEENRGYVDLQLCQWNGAKLESGSIEYQSDGSVEVSDLRCPYESLPSSNSTLSFKIFKGGENYWPFIEIKASPAKLLQGHNVFGSVDVEKCLMALCQAFVAGMPELSSMLDWHHAEIKQIDVTFSAQLSSQSQGRQVISALKNVSSGQTRSSKNSHATTCYFGVNSNGKKSSRHKQLKIYLKGAELEAQIAQYEQKLKKQNNSLVKKQLEAMSHPDVIDFAQNALRFEASILPRMLNRLGVPTHLESFITYAESFNGCLVESLWKEAFKDVFDAIGDCDVNVFNDEEIFDALKREYGAITPSGNVSYAKANRLFRFYRDFKNEGWEEVKRTTAKPTFFRNVGLLTKVVSKAHLQNLKGIGQNVVPMLKIINVDFSRQHPSSYVEPDSLAQQMFPELRAVS